MCARDLIALLIAELLLICCCLRSFSICASLLVNAKGKRGDEKLKLQNTLDGEGKGS